MRDDELRARRLERVGKPRALARGAAQLLAELREPRLLQRARRALRLELGARERERAGQLVGGRRCSRRRLGRGARALCTASRLGLCVGGRLPLVQLVHQQPDRVAQRLVLLPQRARLGAPRRAVRRRRVRDRARARRVAQRADRLGRVQVGRRAAADHDRAAVAAQRVTQQAREDVVPVGHVAAALGQRVDHVAEHKQAGVDRGRLGEARAGDLGLADALAAGEVDQVQLCLEHLLDKRAADAAAEAALLAAESGRKAAGAGRALERSAADAAGAGVQRRQPAGAGRAPRDLAHAHGEDGVAARRRRVERRRGRAARAQAVEQALQQLRGRLDADLLQAH